MSKIRRLAALAPALLLVLLLVLSSFAQAEDRSLRPAGETNATSDLTPREPGMFYKFLHSFAPETAVTVWRSSRPDLEKLIRDRGFQLGAPVYLRVFKEDGIIEAWMKKGERFELFEMYPICIHSGALGPKQKTGDRQAPEGFYEVGLKQLHPNSQYHLAFNMGYPNDYDQSWGRTGSHLMIHGSCASIGCYALTDKNIEEVYTLVSAALMNGQLSVPVHAFPFRMTQKALIRHQNNKWIDFWVNELLPVYQAFDISGTPPRMMVCDKTYQIMDGLDAKDLPDNCTPITAWQ